MDGGKKYFNSLNLYMCTYVCEKRQLCTYISVVFFCFTAFFGRIVQSAVSGPVRAFNLSKQEINGDSVGIKRNRNVS